MRAFFYTPFSFGKNEQTKMSDIGEHVSRLDGLLDPVGVAGQHRFDVKDGVDFHFLVKQQRE